MKNFVSAIIVAAGGSVRMGIADSKQFLPLLGRPAIEYTLQAFQKCDLIREVIVVCREQDMERIRQIADENGFSKVTRLVPGGASTQFTTVRVPLLPLRRSSASQRRRSKREPLRSAQPSPTR